MKTLLTKTIFALMVAFIGLTSAKAQGNPMFTLDDSLVEETYNGGDFVGVGTEISILNNGTLNFYFLGSGGDPFTADIHFVFKNFDTGEFILADFNSPNIPSTGINYGSDDSVYVGIYVDNTMNSVAPTFFVEYLIESGEWTQYYEVLTITMNSHSVSVATSKVLKFDVYPNPSNGTFYVDLDEIGCSYSLTNIQGQTIESGQMKSEFQIEGTGVYFLTFEKNQMKTTKRIIKI